MLISRGDNTIVITVENFWDWMDLFDNGKEDEITFELNAEILDVFFPDWDTYVDSDNPFEGLDGEGMYNVEGGECYLMAKDPETGEDRGFEAFLDFTGTATFKITPNHPMP